MLENVFKKTVVLREPTGYSDGKHVYGPPETIPCVPLMDSQDMRDMFGNVDSAAGFFLLRIDRKVKLNSKLEYDGNEFMVLSSQECPDPLSLEITACLVAV